jgi:hypothetical protein
VKLKSADLTAIWVIEKERAGCTALIKTKVKIDTQQINPMVRAMVIVPLSDNPNDDKFMKIFGKMKPRVVAVANDLLLCSMGIMARKVKPA